MHLTKFGDNILKISMISMISRKGWVVLDEKTIVLIKLR